MTTLEKILLVLIAIGLVGLVIYFFFKDQIEAWLKGVGKGGEGTTTTTTTKPPTPTQPPSISTDKSEYQVGEMIKWSASNLVNGKTYIVGALKNGKVYYVESRDKFTANSPNAVGSYYVGENIVGNIQFGIFDEKFNAIDLKNITVKSITQPLYPIGGGYFII